MDLVDVDLQPRMPAHADLIVGADPAATDELETNRAQVRSYGIPLTLRALLP